MINIYDLHKSFGNKQVLVGINLDIKPNEVTAIIGQSGCGKTILLKLIMGLLKPDKGRIEIFGKDITNLNGQELSQIQQKTGMLFQQAALFDSLTVGENVGFFLYENTSLDKKNIQRIVTEKLAMVGLSGIEELKPASLSGGMRKRVGLARTIAYNPEIILYDEPTTGIDPVMGAAIDRLIKKLKEELSHTAVVVTHDMTSVYRIADRIAMLFEGKIIEVGTPSQIRESKHPAVRQFIRGEAEGPLTKKV